MRYNMGVGVRNRNHRLRTIWTPEMDRYFIDLMLEQVGKEKTRDDHLFSKRAWKHMTTMFNSKFGSKYEKDVLKNRHKMLRNLYRALNNLLEQKGFKWDETREIVTADSGVWDEYIKVHPAARPYKMKTIPYYSDLCKIYGTLGVGGMSTVPEQSANCVRNLDDNTMDPSYVCKIATESLHDIMIDEDYGIAMAKGPVDDETYHLLSEMEPSVGARTRTNWQPPMDRYFIDLMFDQVKKGNHADGLLRKQSWREMISLFNDKFGFNYGVDILKNRYKTLRRQYIAVKNLLELDGFAWDDARQMVVADDSIWQNYIKAHTDARQYMTRPIPHFNHLCSIFRDLSSDEKDNISTHQSPAASASSYDHFHDFNTTTTNQTTKWGPPETPPITGSLKKSRAKDEGAAHAVCETATAVSSLPDKRNEDENANGGIPVQVVVTGIQELPDMDEELVLDACDLLLDDEKKAKTFLALDVKLRKKWLLRKLRPCVNSVECI